MNIVYITSRYPHLSETFIAREMEQLTRLGHVIIICRLKWVTPWTPKVGLKVKQAHTVKPQFNPLLWINGLLWAFRKKPTEMRSVWQDFKLTRGRLTSRIKLLTILLTTLRLAQYLHKQEISHIRGHFLHSEAISAMWLGRLLNVPHSLTAQTIITYFPGSIVYKTIRSAAFCVATTDETMDLLKTIRGSKEKVYLIRSGVDLKQFVIPSTSIKKPQPPLLLAVARLVKKKGLDLLIHACAILRDEGINYTCKIVGDGPEYNPLSQLIKALNLEDQVALTGPLPFEKVKSYYQDASIAVLPCRDSKDEYDRDGLPNTLIEALAFGVPTVATELAAIPDLIIHRQTGLLVPLEDITSLVAAIRQLLEDANLHMSLARNGREKIEKEFDITKTARQLEAAILQNLRVSATLLQNSSKSQS
jgi:colanic acid/amylovoran biosynthesis glycosyltransferase